ncbi:MAG: hypothetical protein R2705_05740 [Ilumatobacteraceae bacterium]
MSEWSELPMGSASLPSYCRRSHGAAPDLAEVERMMSTTPDGTTPVNTARTGAGILAVVVGAVLLACGCGPSAPPDGAHESAVAPAVALVQDTPTTVPDSVVAATTPAVAVTSEPPQGDGQVTVDVRARIESSVRSHKDRFRACIASPSDCDPDRFGAPGSPYVAWLGGLRDWYLEGGYVARLHDEVSWLEVDEIVVDEAAGIATVVICDVDGDWIVEPAAMAGRDIVVDDSVVARKQRIELHRAEDGSWLRVVHEDLTTNRGHTECIE